MNGRFSQRVVSLFWFALIVLIPSFPVVFRDLGLIGPLIYIPVATTLFLLLPRYGHFLSKAQTRWLMIGAFCLLVVSFFVVYPIADSGIVGGGGDRDDALNRATGALLRAEYPYYEPTYMGNPISPLPGSLLIAIPFVLLGNGAYQNFFWFALFLLAFGHHAVDQTARRLSGARAALPVLFTALVLYPEFLRELWVGSDLPANSIYLFLAILLLARVRRRWQLLVASVLLGLAFSSRIHYIVILPLLFSFLFRRKGLVAAAGSTFVTVLSFLAFTLPFYLYDPAGFSPMHTVARLARFNVLPPYTGLVPVATAALALLLAVRQIDTLVEFSMSAVLVLAFPLVVGVFVAAFDAGVVNWDLLRYGISYFSFGMWVLWEPGSGIVGRHLHAPAS